MSYRIEIPISLEPHSRLLHNGPRKAIWCLVCDEVFSEAEEYATHGCASVVERATS